MASTATSAAKIVGKLAAMGGLTVAGAVATNYLNDLVPNLGDTVNWVGAVAIPAGVAAGSVTPGVAVVTGAVAVGGAVTAVVVEATPGVAGAPTIPVAGGRCATRRLCAASTTASFESIWLRK